MPTTTMQPQDVAFIKLYFINLLNDEKFVSVFQARTLGNSIARIADCLTTEQVEILVYHIENIL